MKSGRVAASAALVAVLLVCVARAGGFSYDLRGYVKDYPATWEQRSTSLGGAVESQTWFNSTRARLKGKWFATSRLTLAADYEARLLASNEASGLSGLSGQGSAGGLVDLTWTPVSREHVTLTHTFDRLYAQWYSPRFVATVGRQRIAWGVATYFSPLDKFAPFAPAEIDKEEKAGVDAALVSFPWGSLSNVEAVYAVQRIEEPPSPLASRTKETRHRLGARLRTNVRDWDIALLGGRFDGANVAGASLSGYIREAGVHGEVLFAHDAIRRTERYASYVYRRGNFVQASVGGSYGFAWRNLTASGELYYDGSGSADNAGYDWVGLSLGNRLTLARHYAAVSLTGLLTPLLTASLVSLINLDEPAFLVQPQLEYSVEENLDVKLGVQVNNGDAQSEYGVMDNLFYLGVSWYFGA